MAVGKVAYTPKKPTVESVGAIPVSAKDLRQGTNYEDIFSTTLSSNHDCWNKWCRAVGAAGIIENAPEPNVAVWYEVFTGGVGNRAFQIAIGCYTHQRDIFIRYMHDAVWSDWTTGFLPLTGGTLSGGLILDKGDGRFVSYSLQRLIDEVTYKVNYGLGINKDALIELYDETNGGQLATFSVRKDGAYYNNKHILHTGNKPTGTYTGNGDATARTIDTGCGLYNNASACVISGGGCTTILGINGGISIYYTNGTVTGIKKAEGCFYLGVINLATTNSALNASGSTYTYQVL